MDAPVRAARVLHCAPFRLASGKLFTARMESRAGPARLMSIGRVREIWRYPVKSMAGERLSTCTVGRLGLSGDRTWAVRDVATGEIHNAKRFPILLQCAARTRPAPPDGLVSGVEVTCPDGSTFGADSPELPDRLSSLMGHAVTLEPVRPARDRAFYRRRAPGAAVLGKIAAFRTVRRLMSRFADRGAMGAELRATFGREAGEPLPDLTDVPAELFEFYTPPGTYFDVCPLHVLTTSTLALMSRVNPQADWDIRRFRPNILLETEGEPSAPLEPAWVGRQLSVGGFTLKGEMLTVRCAMPVHPQGTLPRDPSILRTIVRQADQCLGLYATVRRPGTVAVGDQAQLCV